MSPDAIIGAGALWVAIPLAGLAGLISFVSPCVLPLVPGYLGFIAGAVEPRGSRRADAAAAAAATGVAAATAHPDPRPRVLAGSRLDTARDVTAAPGERRSRRGRLVGGVLLFIAGFTVVFVAAVILGGALGRFLLAYQDVITRILGVAVIVLGLVFAGGFGPLQRTMRIGLKNDLGLVGAPLLGIALGVGWTPCIGPTLAAITAVSWNLGDPGRAVLLGLAYSAGLGIPFLAIALGLGWASRSTAFVRRHIRAFNIAGGAVLVVLGVLMVTGLWTTLMSVVQAAVAGVPLPL